MKRLLLLPAILVAAALAGCIPVRHHAFYDVGLEMVETTGPVTDRTALDADALVFENEQLAIEWFPDYGGFDFVLENRTEEDLWLLWADAVFADADGHCTPLYHVYEGMEIPSKSGTGTRPSRILPGKSLADRAHPADRLAYDGYGNPYFRGYLPESAVGDLAGFTAAIEAFEGRDVRVLLPIRQGAVVTDYTFVFEILEAGVVPGEDRNVARRGDEVPGP